MQRQSSVSEAEAASAWMASGMEEDLMHGQRKGKHDALLSMTGRQKTGLTVAMMLLFRKVPRWLGGG